MTPIGPLKLKRMPEQVRRRLEMATAAAWQDVVDAHAEHATRFVALVQDRLPFDQAVERYLTDTDLRDPAAAAVRARVFIRLEQAPGFPAAGDAQPSPGGEGTEGGPEGAVGLKRFRPDVLARGIARRVREHEAFEGSVRLAIARAEEAVLQAHIDNAVQFTDILSGNLALDEAVEDYIDVMRLTGGRAQSVFQRTMARLADLHLPAQEVPPAGPV